MELIFADLEVLERAITKTTKNMKADRKLAGQLEILNRAKSWLESGKNIRAMEMDEDDHAVLDEIDLLTAKPIIYVANVSEDDVADKSNPYVEQVSKLAAEEGAKCVQICAEIEAEMAELEDDERDAFLEDLGIDESGLDKLIKASYSLLNLISYLTAGEPEVRAWTIQKGTKAPQAAGKIHTDFEKGFIRAETISYEQLVECGGNLGKAREKGLIRSEGKEYVVQDGDVIHFLFNV